jgi:phosphoribosyl 1,2-cyclic phosphodiesterase
MTVKFWGVRGSIPTPLNNDQLKSRIAAVVQRVKSHDLKNAETREAFLSKLPPYLFGTVGGNTTCIELRASEEHIIIVDAGSGIRELGNELATVRNRVKVIHLFFSHYHYDHLQGLPFFQPALKKGYHINFYSPKHSFESVVRDHMRAPYFPVSMDLLPASYSFHVLNDSKLEIGGTTIHWKKMKHPQECYSYRFSHNGKVIIFSTDSEITEREFKQNEENKRYFEGSDILILDSQYTLEESIDKIDWGHSSYSMAVDLAAQWKIKNLVLFHHEPMYNDKKILGILRSAQWYAKHLENCHTDIHLAVEGLELSV